MYNIYRSEHFPAVHVVLSADSLPKDVIPFNLLYLAGDLELVKERVKPQYLPFAKGSQRKIFHFLEHIGYCFYKWPGKVLGEGLGDVLADDALEADGLENSGGES